LRAILQAGRLTRVVGVLIGDYPAGLDIDRC
jgi:hypothetical protein